MTSTVTSRRVQQAEDFDKDLRRLVEEARSEKVMARGRQHFVDFVQAVVAATTKKMDDAENLWREVKSLEQVHDD